MNREEIMEQIRECQRQIENLEDMKEELYKRLDMVDDSITEAA